MSTVERPAVPPLIEGQRLGQSEFHQLYESMPPGIRVELIGGVVCMASPVGKRHSINSTNAVGWLWTYRSRTPGTELGDKGSTALDHLGEIQPDAFLRILPECGDQTREYGRIIRGATELLVEIADISRSIDLGEKLAEYERVGTWEYVFFTIDPDEIFWHIRQRGRLVRIFPEADGLYRSSIFPGVWLDSTAMIADDSLGIRRALDRVSRHKNPRISWRSWPPERYSERIRSQVV